MGTFLFILIGMLVFLSVLEMHHSRERE